jgi:hypothetical protein
MATFLPKSPFIIIKASKLEPGGMLYALTATAKRAATINYIINNKIA